MNYYLSSKIKYKSKYGEISNSIIEEKKSKFYTYIFNIRSEAEAIDYIELIKKDNKDARHVVFIYNYIENGQKKIRFSDDGEPKGTGTKAIYELLEKENIVNTCIVIVRYFGGILLGAGPLSRTYLNGAREAILSCEKEILYNYVHITRKLEYSKYESIKNRLDDYISKSIIINLNIEYTNIITLNFDIIDLYIDELRELI